MPKDTRFPPILVYLVGGASLVLIIAGLKLAAPIVNMVLISFLLAFSISPIQNWLIRKGLPKGLAVLITVLIILIGGSGLISIMAVSVAGLIGELPVYEARITGLWNAINAFFIDHGLNISGLFSLKEFDPRQAGRVGRQFAGSRIAGIEPKSVRRDHHGL